MIQKETIKTQYGNIAAYRKGTGPKTVMLLHGAGCDSTMLSWREVFKALSDDFTVYAFDFLGYGNSDRTDDLAGDSFFDTHIECVKTVVSYYGLTDFVLAAIPRMLRRLFLSIPGAFQKRCLSIVSAIGM